jgi:DNA invertase Pin-like site-specific DNA recombinase
MLMNAAIYARTSPDCPLSAEDQIECLKTIADQQGWTVTKVFTDRPMPMRKGKERRPGEAALLDTIRSGGVQRILVWSIDRVGRSLDELVEFIETCRVADVGPHRAQRPSARGGFSLTDDARAGHQL